MQIDVLKAKDLGDLAVAWRALQRRERMTDSPFLSPGWAEAVEYARGGRGVRVLVVSEGGRPAAFMPVQAGPVTAIAAGGAMTDYDGVVGETPEGLDAVDLVRALGVSRLDFNLAPPGQSLLARHARGSSRTWIVDLPDGYAAYAAGRRAAGVHAHRELERKRRKAEREAGPLVFTPCAGARADFDRLIALKRAQYRATGRTDIFAAGWTYRLVEHLFEVPRPGCVGALFTLHLAGELAAVQFHLMGDRTIHAWVIAHEPRFDRFAPGLLLFREILAWMDGQPHDWLDLGYGDYRFKRELANRSVELARGFVGAPSAASLVRGAAWGFQRMALSLPLGRVSELPDRAMRRLDLWRGLR